jgi:thiol:disulfide interchange protein DsbD
MAFLATSTGSTPKRRRADVRALVAAGILLAAASAFGADPKLLPPEQAFRFSARALDDRTVEARFAVEGGYYLYRDKLKFAAEPTVVALAPPDLPPGKVKEDPFFGRVETYRGDVVVKLPLANAAAGQSIVLVADSQGCADQGVCYPVNRQQVTLVVPAAGKGPGPVVEAHPRKKSWFN